MQRFSRVLLVVVFTALVFGQPGSLSEPFPLYNTPTVKIVFDAYPAVANVVQIEVWIYNQQGARDDPTARVAAIAHVLSEAAVANEIPLLEHVQDLPDDLYFFTLRAVREDLVRSEWTEEYVFRKAWGVLVPPPVGCVLGF